MLKLCLVCVFACGYVCEHKDAGIGQKNVSDPLRLELQTVMRHLMWGLGAESGFSVRAAHDLNC